MKTNPLPILRVTAVVTGLLLCLFPAAPSASAAVIGANNATWTSGGSTDWNTNGNWDTAQYPNSTTDQAIFSNQSSVLNVTLSGSVSVDRIIFTGTAGPYTISTQSSNVDFWGAGLVNNSGRTQTFINGGVSLKNDPAMTFHNSSSAGNAVITNLAGGVVNFFDTSSAGTATITNAASGTNVLVNNSATAAKATIINQGSGSFIEIAGTASGGLATIINQNPTAFIDLSHLTSSGTTLGSVAGNGTIFLGSKNLTVGGNNLSTMFSGVIADGTPTGPVLGATGGSLTKVGAGTLNLTGINTYTGNTNVNGGTLLINGSIISPMTFVNAGGTLGGSGLINGTVINNGGTISPGNSPGTLTLKGNYMQGANGSLQIQVASTSIFDKLIMGGRASLGGTLDVDPLNGFQLKRGETFQFLTAAGGVSGTFANFIQPNTGTILKFGLVYESNGVLLEAEMGSFVLNGLTPNQTSVARELDRVVNDRRAGKLIDFLTTEQLGQLPNDFDKIAAEEYTSIFTLGTSFDNVQSLNIQRRTDDIRSGAMGFSAAGFHTAGAGPSYSGGFGFAGPNSDDGKESKEIKNVAPEEKRWGVFITGVGEWVGVSDDSNARGYDINTGGFTLGIDFKVCSHFAVGLMAGYVGTGVDLNDGGRVLVNGGKLGLYATAFGDGFYADAGVTGGYSSYDVNRSALQGTARGETDGGDLNVLFGAGYDWKMGAFSIGPTATFNYTYVGIRDFTETGSLAPLHFASQGQESIRSAFGVKASYECKCGSVIVKPELRAAWQHEYGDTAYAIDSSFANGAGNIFTVTGPNVGRDSLLLGAGFAVQWSDRCSNYIYYDGELGATRYNSQNVSGGCRLAF